MFLEQFFDLIFDFGESWKVTDVRVDFKREEVDFFVEFMDKQGLCPELDDL